MSKKNILFIIIGVFVVLLGILIWNTFFLTPSMVLLPQNRSLKNAPPQPTQITENFPPKPSIDLIPKITPTETPVNVVTTSTLDINVNYKTTYLPEGWIVTSTTEGYMYYDSLERYIGSIEGELPYSLFIRLDNKFTNITEYLEQNKNCIENKEFLTIQNRNAVRFIDVCAYGKSQIILIELGKYLFVAYDYYSQGLLEEIDKILGSLEIIDKQNNITK